MTKPKNVVPTRREFMRMGDILREQLSVKEGDNLNYRPGADDASVAHTLNTEFNRKAPMILGSGHIRRFRHEIFGRTSEEQTYLENLRAAKAVTKAKRNGKLSEIVTIAGQTVLPEDRLRTLEQLVHTLTQEAQIERNRAREFEARVQRLEKEWGVMPSSAVVAVEAP